MEQENAIQFGISAQFRRNLAVNQRKVMLNSEVSKDSISEVMYYLYSLESLDTQCGSKEPIEILINTNGGDVEQGLVLISYIEHLKDVGYEITTTTIGNAYSMGLFLACVGSKRKGYRHSKYLWHEISSGNFGKLSSIKEDVAYCDVLVKEVEQILKDNTNIPTEKLDEWRLQRRDVYITAEEALQYNIIDEIV